MDKNIITTTKQALDYFNDELVAKKISNDLQIGYLAENPLLSLMGTGKNRAIRTVISNTLNPLTIPLGGLIDGDAQYGNTHMFSELSEISFLSQQFTPQILTKAVQLEIEPYRARTGLDYVAEAKRQLSDWLGEHTLKTQMANLTHNFTNAVFADKTNGVKTPSQNQKISTVCKTIEADDFLTLAVLERAIDMARDGEYYDGDNKKGFTLDPIKLSKQSLGAGGAEYIQEDYIIIISRTQERQLLKDPRYIALYENAVARGDNHPYLTGFRVRVKGCPIMVMKNWDGENGGGMPNSHTDQDIINKYLRNLPDDTIKPLSDYKGANNCKVAIGCLIGASALVHIADQEVKTYIEKHPQDPRKLMIGIQKILTAEKVRFYANNKASKNPRNGKDYGVIGIFSSGAEV